ncbi:hypothetical protein Asulf_01482 [Archaeoglobus sulfaticallidus PM70-1]|uniref:Uncharacterized protein n=1 Tax=Archaeoglobus sulfaticallidus PM70-1 TaxID=387631 RepID=N0BMH6_9EURY|nr:DVU0298 family protein [Archaeoglobus sulfaticallidus]AGK61465.1 hypothetical protein Asulf_01482 [Archaeoglobus sulfaticallidus PM70-1]
MKQRIAEIVRGRRYEELLELSHKRGLKKVATSLISFLYLDELMVFHSAEAIGVVCREIEKRDDEFVRNILRRLFWHLSDESGAYCKGAPLAIGEIGRNCPVAFDNFRNMLLALLRNEEVEKKYVLYAIYRSAREMRSAYPDPVEEIKPYLRYSGEIKAYAILALIALGYIPEIDADERVRIYIDGDFREIALVELKNFVNRENVK